ncbi:NAD(P)/FAD-dependent oxidoreductase [Clostridium sp. D2Q-11]|uniref:NAD(P)/FAD-dependent oxidoreductase n=1 Tax=Anaeromonas frigoriresistens TaxID=2683708 RepID=A0A942UV01_9FIRM|nr:NAD(P)/FAD-dependent oxidoreductase [Anaeromonas frigoriresistens]MBS4539598.1 NAD(P)/FAD-dependent oxidoreductase [Anaeromonas frigoriresistens]
MYDVAIIGAGVIGSYIARELSKYKLNIAIVEKDNEVSNGTTKANSAIVHGGYDAKPGTKMAKFNASGNPMFDKVCKELDVPFKRIGSLVLAFNDEEMEALKELYNRGIENQIPNVEIIDKDKILKMEPNINNDVIGALYSPTAGIVGVYELAIALTENAMDNGAKLFLNNEVKDIKKIDKGYKILTNNLEMQSKYIINCAGVYADKINNMVAKESFKITPKRGQYYILDKSASNITNHVIFQVPNKFGKGVLIAPTVHGNIIVGPDSQALNDDQRDETQTSGDNLDYVKNTASKSIENIPFHKTITNFSGLRAEPNTGDFIIEESEDAKGFINVAGIKSPGLSSAPSIAEYVLDIIKNISNNLEENKEFNPRRKMIVFDELSKEEKAELIKKDPRYGRVICRCENITEGEIVDSIKKNGGPTTVDGIKRRVRPGAGRCQGGFCGPRVMEILARELDKDIEEIMKDGQKSNILTGKTKS